MANKTLSSLLILVFGTALCLSQTPPAPLSRTDILGRLAAGSSPSYVAYVIKTRGISFSPREHDVTLVRLAGGSGILAERLSTARPEESLVAPLQSDPPYFHLAKCAQLLQLGAVAQAAGECREAMTENSASPWPLIAITRCVEDPMRRRGDTVSLLRRAVELAPTLSETHLALSQAVEPPERQKELRQAAQLDPEHLDLTLHGIGYETGVGYSGVQSPEKLSAIEAGFASAHAAAARDYAREGKMDEMLAEMRKAIRLEPDNPALHGEFAWLRWGVGDEEGGLAELDEMIRASPRSHYWREMRGRALLLAGRQDSAIAAFRDALRLFPMDYDVTYFLVELLLKKGERDDAMAVFRGYMDESRYVDRDSPEGNARRVFPKQLGDLLVESGDYEAAAAVFTEVLSEEADARTMNALGGVRLAQGRLDDAMNEYRRAIQADSAFADPHYNLALCLFRESRWDEAIAENRIALQIDPGYSGAQMLIGEAEFRKGNIAGAIQEYKQVLEGNPDNARAANNLAWIYATSTNLDYRDPGAALQLAQHAVELEQGASGGSAQQTAAFLDTLAEALFINGRPEEALKAEESAVELDPNDAEILKRFEKLRNVVQKACKP